MESKKLRKKLIENFGYDLTRSQEYAIDLLADFLNNSSSNQCFVLRGFAGTGKTTLIASCVRYLAENEAKFTLLAPTGRAAKVLAYYTGYNAYTIHRWIYRQKSSLDGIGKFNLGKNSQKDTLFIVDEASMISNNNSEDSFFGTGHLLDDLLEFVFSGTNCKLILAGDEAQLPPVKLESSPALNKLMLLGYGLDIKETILKDVVRQVNSSGILINATTIRSIINTERIEFPKLVTKNFNDLMRIDGAELQETLEASYGKYGEEETVVICYSNKRANKYNQGIRNRILWREAELVSGDMLMVVRNNYFWVQNNQNIGFIANGDTIRVRRVASSYDQYGFRFADATICLPDYNDTELDVTLLLDTLSIDGPALPNEQWKKLYESILEDYSYIPEKKIKQQKVLADKHLNALQVKYAYAITCHKAQGGQWKSVFVDQGFFKNEMLSREYLRWLYTAFTRATERLYLVNFNENFFDD